MQFKQRQPERFTEECDAAMAYEQSAAIFAEFGRVVCISVGFIYQKNGEWYLRVKSFANKDEKTLLQEFAAMASRFLSTSEHALCGHNIKEFDVPYLCRRMLINGVGIPYAMQVAGKKPWETHFIDTLELWKFGDFKNYTSLKVLTTLFGIPTPKDDIDGSLVGEVFYKEDNLPRIAVYCEKDVVATAQLYLKFCGKPLINTDAIEHV